MTTLLFRARERALLGICAAALTAASACKLQDDTKRFDLTTPAPTATPANNPHGTSLNGEPTNAALPPNHPPARGNMGGGDPNDPHLGMGSAATGSTAADDAPFTWTVPARWRVVPSPSPMRKATYQIPKAPGDSDDAELAVSQAGGDMQANLDRWANQFEEVPKPLKVEKTIGGYKVIIVELNGTYKGSGMPSGGSPAQATNRANTTMLAAIVLASDMPYFFKMVGSRNTVALAKPEFDKMISGIKQP